MAASERGGRFGSPSTEARHAAARSAGKAVQQAENHHDDAEAA
jgi:hypothetical protein